ncbi:MAG: bifunctional phosphopantothenoylcysteine decarboxylase/phosphopantothenate--cysteine ligase CoaBC [Nitrospirae bacterium]|nr:bifunctional phosphopantothenoylcysteine decarboxylase/phosphopantothenate--cysteine ligase CoaBC [Nitrospirota bacterium]
MISPLANKEVLLGVTGGIAAYKSAEVVRLFREKGASVTVVMTESAARFVTPLTFSALSGRPARTNLFDGYDAAISHIELSAKADIFVVAPATANLIGKAASGIADDLLSTTLLAVKCPVLIAPAMNCRMYESPVVKRNIEMLKGFGYGFIGPDEGPMACGEYGWGRMSEPSAIVAAAEGMLAHGGQFVGKTVLVTAGPTLEDMDPVRFIGNRAAGRMGYAVAREAARRGARVVLVSGPVSLVPPAGVELVSVRSALEMEAAVNAAAKDADAVIMAAAVSDYRPETVSHTKIKKGADETTVRLVKNPDILAGLGKRKRPGQLLVGFAAETDDLEKNAKAKLKAKRLDLIAANPVGGETGFGGDLNRLRLYGRAGHLLDTGVVTKMEAARALLDVIFDAMQGLSLK